MILDLFSCKFNELPTDHSDRLIISPDYSVDDIVEHAIDQNVVNLSIHFNDKEQFWAVSRGPTRFGTLVREKLRIAKKYDMFPVEIPKSSDLKHSVAAIRNMLSQLSIVASVQNTPKHYIVDYKQPVHKTTPDWVQRYKAGEQVVTIDVPDDIMYSSFVARLHREAERQGCTISLRRNKQARKVDIYVNSKPLTTHQQILKWIGELPYDMPTPIPKKWQSYRPVMYSSPFNVKLEGVTLTKVKYLYKRTQPGVVSAVTNGFLIASVHCESVAALLRNPDLLELMETKLHEAGVI